MSQGIKEPVVKQERDLAENEDSKMLHEQNNGFYRDEGNIPMKDMIKFETTSDDDSDNTQMSENIESHNERGLFNSLHSKDDDLMDIENDSLLGDVNFDISEMLDSVEGVTTAGASNIEKSQESSDEDITLQSLKSRKRVNLTEDTESGHILNRQIQITSEHKQGNTDPVAALHKEGHNTAKKQNFESHLLTHTSKKHITKSHLCNKCDFKCIRKEDLKWHLWTHIGRQSFLCDKCSFKCSTQGLLKWHLLTHSDKKPFSCGKCNYKSINRDQLKEHLLTHKGKKPFSCRKCNFKCIEKASLKRHLIQH